MQKSLSAVSLFSLDPIQILFILPKYNESKEFLVNAILMIFSVFPFIKSY